MCVKKEQLRVGTSPLSASNPLSRVHGGALRICFEFVSQLLQNSTLTMSEGRLEQIKPCKYSQAATGTRFFSWFNFELILKNEASLEESIFDEVVKEIFIFE